MKKKDKIPFETVVRAKADLLSGEPKIKTLNKYNISEKRLTKASEAIGQIIASDDPNFALEKEIIESALSAKLKPIKARLAAKSLEILDEADKLTLERLKDPIRPMKTKDILSISDIHSKRFARITGLEEDPTGGLNPDEKRKTVNIFVQTMINRHTTKLDEERTTVNNSGLDTSSIDGEIVDNLAE